VQKRIISAIAVVVATILVPLAHAQELKPLRVLIGSLPTSGYVGALYYAKDSGLYEKAGLDVEITVGKGSHTSINSLVAGSSDVVVAAGLAAIQNADKGQPIVVIGSQLGRNGTGFFVPEGEMLQSLSDLEGKNVLFLNPGTEQVFRALLSKTGGDPEKVQMTQVPQVGTAFSMYISNKADAIMTIILGRAIIGKTRPSDFFGLDGLGMAEPTFAWMVRPDYLAENKEILRTFLRVTYDAVGTLNENPEMAVGPFVAHVPGAKPDAALADYFTVLSYQCAPGQTVVGRMSEEAWREAADLYKSVGQISEEFDVTKIFTNELFDQDPVSTAACPG